LLWQDNSTFSVKVIPGNDNAAPSNILKRAEALLKKEGAGNIDKVFCVFDRDQYPCFQSTLDAIAKEKKYKIVTIPSSPCFEVWLRLHYGYTDKPFADCAEVTQDITRLDPTYQKGILTNIFQSHENISQAVSHADKLEGTHNALLHTEQRCITYTRIHHIIRYFQEKVESKQQRQLLS
jgi:RloB-like protein